MKIGTRVGIDLIYARSKRHDAVAFVSRGYDFKIAKQDKGGWPDYSASRFVNTQSPLGNPDEVKRWLAGRHDLAALIQHEPSADVRVALVEYLTGAGFCELIPLTGAISQKHVIEVDDEPIITSVVTPDGSRSLVEPDFMASLREAAR